MDRTVDMALRREVNNHIAAFDGRCRRFRIANVALGEFHARVVGQVVRAAGIRQRVEHAD